MHVQVGTLGKWLEKGVELGRAGLPGGIEGAGGASFGESERDVRGWSGMCYLRSQSGRAEGKSQSECKDE
jgi:hypothetical protein